jgi:hypothetical protein
MSTSSAYIPLALKARPAQGPGPLAAIKRVLPAPVPLQPVRMPVREPPAAPSSHSVLLGA